MAESTRLAVFSLSPLPPPSPEGTLQWWHGLVGWQGWKQASALPGFSAKHQNKSKQGKSKEGCEVWAPGAREQGQNACWHPGCRAERRRVLQPTASRCTTSEGKSRCEDLAQVPSPPAVEQGGSFCPDHKRCDHSGLLSIRCNSHHIINVLPQGGTFVWLGHQQVSLTQPKMKRVKGDNIGSI